MTAPKEQAYDDEMMNMYAKPIWMRTNLPPDADRQNRPYYRSGDDYELVRHQN